MKRIIEKLSNQHGSFVDSQMKVKEIKNIWQFAARMFFQGSSRVIPMVLSLARRRSGKQLGTPSISNRPQMFTSRLLSPRPFSSSVSLYLSPQWKVEKKRTGNIVFQLWNCLFLLPTAFLHFPTLCPRCGQSGVELTKQCIKNLDKLLELKMEMLVFLKGFSSSCYGTVFAILTDYHLKQLYIHGQIN